jgi:hypothetical protein
MEAPKKARAPRVTAPGAQRLTLTGVMAVPDGFGRIRVLLMDPLPSGAPDRSWARLRSEIWGGAADHVPYTLHSTCVEGVQGEFWAVPPARRKQYWLEVAGELRGREVRVEVTVRRFSYAARAKSPTGGVRAATEAAPIKGAALDVASIDLLTPPAASPGLAPSQGTADGGAAVPHI